MGRSLVVRSRNLTLGGTDAGRYHDLGSELEIHVYEVRRGEAVRRFMATVTLGEVSLRKETAFV